MITIEITAGLLLAFFWAFWVFAFGGWWSGPDGTGQPVTPESRITTGGGRLTLYAKWAPRP